MFLVVIIKNLTHLFPMHPYSTPLKYQKTILESTYNGTAHGPSIC